MAQAEYIVRLRFPRPCDQDLIIRLHEIVFLLKLLKDEQSYNPIVDELETKIKETIDNMEWIKE